MTKKMLPRPIKHARPAATQLKLLERLRNMYIPFMAFGEVVCSRYYSIPLKLRIPTRNLSGSSPLKTGLMESREAMEK